jgi:hypothetical protein
MGADRPACAVTLKGGEREPQPRSHKLLNFVSCVQQHEEVAGNTGEWELTVQGHIEPHAKAALTECLVDVYTVLSQGICAVLLSLGSLGCAWCQKLARTSQQCATGGSQALAANSMKKGQIEVRHTRSGIDHSRAPTVAVLYVPAVKCEVASVNGAGDCLLAGTMAALMQGCSVKDALCVGVLAAGTSCMHDASIPQELSAGWHSEALRDVERSCVACEGRLVHRLQTSKL